PSGWATSCTGVRTTSRAVPACCSCRRPAARSTRTRGFPHGSSTASRTRRPVPPPPPTWPSGSSAAPAAPSRPSRPSDAHAHQPKNEPDPTVTVGSGENFEQEGGSGEVADDVDHDVHQAFVVVTGDVPAGAEPDHDLVGDRLAAHDVQV